MAEKYNYSLIKSSKINVAVRHNFKKYICILTAVVLLIMTLTACDAQKKSVPDDKAIDKILVGKQKVNVSILTDKGEMVAELRPDLMPTTVRNFIKLTEMKFYDGLTFHRVEDWVIQGGDPTGKGTGGPGWAIKLETNPQLKNVKYCIAMARGESLDSAGSQFYILKRDTPQLDTKYAVFGNIIKGQEAVDKIVIGDKMKTVRIIE